MEQSGSRGSSHPFAVLLLPFTKNPRMGKVGKDNNGLPGPTSLLRLPEHRVVSRLEYLLRGSLHNFSGQSVPVLSHLQSEEVQVELPVHQFLPVASCPIAQHHQEEAGSIFLPSLDTGILQHQSSLLDAEQAQLPQPFLIRETPASEK